MPNQAQPIITIAITGLTSAESPTDAAEAHGTGTRDRLLRGLMQRPVQLPAREGAALIQR